MPTSRFQHIKRSSDIIVLSADLFQRDWAVIGWLVTIVEGVDAEDMERRKRIARVTFVFVEPR
jgi:hypothetical protein